MMLVRRLCVAFVAAAALLPAGHPAVATAPVRILTLGDSITAPSRWQAETVRLLTDHGVDSTIINAAVAGSRCSYWPDRIGQLLADWQPDLVVLACGTNDDPSELMPWGESRTGWSIRVVIEATYAYRPAARARTLPVLVAYSDVLSAPAWQVANEARTNDALWSNEALYLNTGQLAGIGNFQVIPGTADYTVDDGIHPTPRGYETYGRIVYDSAAQVMGWPTAGMTPLCGMYGHRAGYPRPPWITCP